MQNLAMNSLNVLRAPDSFWIALATRAPGITLVPFETPFGRTDEVLCFYQSVLVGQAYAETRHGGVSVRLAPTLDATRLYPWSTLPEFHNAVETLIRSGVPMAMGCEADIDQALVTQVSDAASASRLLGEVVSFCTGSQSECPSFRYEAF